MDEVELYFAGKWKEKETKEVYTFFSSNNYGKGQVQILNNSTHQSKVQSYEISKLNETWNLNINDRNYIIKIEASNSKSIIMKLETTEYPHASLSFEKF